VLDVGQSKNHKWYNGICEYPVNTLVCGLLTQAFESISYIGSSLFTLIKTKIQENCEKWGEEALKETNKTFCCVFIGAFLKNAFVSTIL